MTIDDKIRNEKLQYDINREATNISASSNKIDEYDYLTGKKTLTSNQRQKIEQTKSAYCPLRKAFEKPTEKQVEALKSLDLSNKKIN